MATLAVRQAIVGDLAAILAFGNAVPEIEPDPAQVWTQWMTDEQGEVLVVTADAEVRGMAHLVLLGAQEAWIEAVQIDWGYVEPAAATLLLRHCATLARERGSAIVRACTLDEASDLQEAFLSAGYDQIGAFGHMLAESAGAIPDTYGGPLLAQPGPAQIETIWEWLERSNVAPLVGGVVIDGQHARGLTDDRVQSALAAGEIWTVTEWEELQALALIATRQHRGATVLTIEYLDGTAQGVGHLALALRTHAAQHGWPLVDAFPADMLIYIDALGGAEFEPLVERPYRLYAREL